MAAFVAGGWAGAVKTWAEAAMSWAEAVMSWAGTVKTVCILKVKV